MLRPKNLLVETLSIAGGLTALIVLWNSAVPTVVPPSVPDDAPSLDAPFVVQNQGQLLSLRDVTTSCEIDKMEWLNPDPSGKVSIFSMGVSHPQPNGELPPGRSAEVSCNVIESMHLRPFTGGDLDSFRLRLVINYTVLLIPRTFVSGHFCWKRARPTGHQWIVCDTLQDTVQH